MSDPMRKAIDDVRRLREEREAYRKSVAALQETKAAVLVVSDKLDAMKWEHEILQQRFDRLVGERDVLASKFREAIHEIGQKAGFKTMLLEQKLASVVEEGERAQLILADVLSSANIESSSIGADPQTVLRGAQALATVRDDCSGIRPRECVLRLSPPPPTAHTPTCSATHK